MVTNCTFNKNYLSCSPDPYQIELEDHESICWINLQSLNKTMIINMTYTYTGVTDMSMTISSIESPMSVLKSIASNKRYIDSLSWTLSFGFGFIFLLHLTIRLLKLFVLYKGEQKINDQML